MSCQLSTFLTGMKKDTREQNGVQVGDEYQKEYRGILNFSVFLLSIIVRCTFQLHLLFLVLLDLSQESQIKFH